MFTASSLLPPLREGDRLTLDEFIRRWEAILRNRLSVRRLPDVKKAELIDGIVYMPSTVGPVHSDGDCLIIGWMFNYAAAA